ncbi:MAG: ribonuclease R [Lachnospiraceae bacterium]|nr:ribonuclease R [Lachnospiraceae bacterium]
MGKTELERRKEMICELVAQESYVPMKEKELAVLLQVSREERPKLRRILEELLTEGRLAVSARGKYQKADGNVLTGIFVSHPKGYGFVEVEGRQEDLFVPQDMTGGAFHHDTVQVALIGGEQGGRRQEARVLRVLARGTARVVGTYQRSKSYGFVVPDNSRMPQDIFVPQERSKGAVTGHKVVVEITDYGNGERSPEGKIVEILGHVNDPGVDILSIVRGYELPEGFGEKVLNQAGRVAGEVTEADMAGRRDLREQQLITIDGEDAKDLDDAVGVTFDGTNYHLGVHIADVTNYVQEGSALDREALARGTSVYLVDRVIPMLPHALSNGICSLNAGVDRLALSCLMTIDAGGNITDYEICESVIRVQRRMSYTEVKRLLTEEELAQDPAFVQDAGLLPMLREMETLSGLLRKRRRERGGIDFDFPECKIVLDESGKPLDIRPYERNVATKMIEDFMLAANETIAQHFYWLELPFLYRVHEAPDQDKIQKLAAFLHNFGYYMKNIGQSGGRAVARSKGHGRAAQPADIHPKEIQKLLQKVEGTPEESMICRLALRSMKQAKYSAACGGHFGLACQFYCHFTSPIRRYPDLQIHRIIKEQLRGRLNEDRIRHYRDILPEVAKQSSKLERRADEAERETDKLKKVEYMEERLGETYRGVVSGVTAWGIYVELENTVEGLVHVSRLPGDYYCYHEDTHEMVGETTGRSFALGQPVTVQVTGTDRMLRTIDFDLA